MRLLAQVNIAALIQTTLLWVGCIASMIIGRSPAIYRTMSVRLAILSFMQTVRILQQVNLKWATVTLIRKNLTVLMHKCVGKMLKIHSA